MPSYLVPWSCGRPGYEAVIGLFLNLCSSDFNRFGSRQLACCVQLSLIPRPHPARISLPVYIRAGGGFGSGTVMSSLWIYTESLTKCIGKT